MFCEVSSSKTDIERTLSSLYTSAGLVFAGSLLTTTTEYRFLTLCHHVSDLVLCVRRTQHSTR